MRIPTASLGLVLAAIVAFNFAEPARAAVYDWDYVTPVWNGDWNTASSWQGGGVPTFAAGDTANVWYCNHDAAIGVFGNDQPWELNPAVHTFGVKLDTTVTLGTIKAGHNTPTAIGDCGTSNHWDQENFLSNLYGTGKIVWDNNGAGALFDQSEMYFRDGWRSEWSLDMELADDLTFDVGAERHRKLSSTLTESGGSRKLTLDIGNRTGENDYFEIGGSSPNTYSGGTELRIGGRFNAAKDGAFGTGHVELLGADSALHLVNTALNDRIGDSAALQLGSGTHLILMNGVTETVDQLWLDGVQQAAGTYGSSSSTATNQLDTWFNEPSGWNYNSGSWDPRSPWDQSGVLTVLSDPGDTPPPPVTTVEWTFDEPGGPDEQGWVDVLTSAVANSNTDFDAIDGDVFAGRDPQSGVGWVAPATDGAGGWNQRDGQNDPFVIRSPSFVLGDSEDLTFFLQGGVSGGAAPANFSGLGDTGFLGMALRDDATGDYVLSEGRPSNGDGWIEGGFTQAELAPYVGGTFTLDYIDDKKGGWGWGGMDSITVPIQSASAVPEPSTFVLAALGLLGLSVVGRRRRKRA